jgi:hypothetical protein
MTRRGWALAAGPDGGWRLGRGDDVVYVSTDPDWLCLTLPVPGRPAADFGLLVERCRRWFLCKYGLDGHGQLVLQAEVPLAGLGYHECRLVLETVAAYAERLRGGRAAEAPGARPGEKQAPGGAGPGEFEVFSQTTLLTYFTTLDAEGWNLRDRLRTNQWQAVYRAPEHVFYVYLGVDPSWAYFQVPMLASPAGPRDGTPAGREMLYRFLLEANERMFWAKFGTDEEGQVLLMLDLPVEMLDQKRFRWAARTLAAYAGDFAYEVQIAATLDRDPHLMAHLAPHP